MKHKLQRMKNHLSLPDKQEKTEKPAVSPPASGVPYQKEWEKVQGYPLYFEDQYIMKREIDYPLDYQHGRHRLNDIFSVFARWSETEEVHPLHPEGRRPEDLLFFDTETTGLSGGTGNMIFLLGDARFKETHVTVTQYFLPGPEAEVAFYHHFLSDVPSMKHLVTYNGKSFDWPQLRTRHTLLRREVPNLPQFGHFDLLHASRRLFKYSLESCKLSIVEHDVLQFKRIDDTPGYMAPMLYFDFLNDPNPGFIEGIMKHNEWDVLSLITLYIELSQRVLEEAPSGRESYEIGRWFEQQGETGKALWCYRKSGAEELTGEEWQEKCLLAEADLLRKEKRLEEAEEKWLLVWSAQQHLAVAAAVELAKYYEHQIKDRSRALKLAQQAAALPEDKLSAKQRADLDKRISRLELKLGQGGK